MWTDKPIRLFASLTLFLGACAQAPGNKPKRWEAHSTASFADSTKPELVNQRWLTAQIRYWGQPWTRVLLLETDSAQWCDGEAQWCHRILVNGWVWNAQPFQAPSWKLVSTGDEGSLRDPFYQVRHNGCCDVGPASEFFSLRTGALVFRSSIDLAHITISASPVDRYVAFLDTWSSLEPSELSRSPRIVGVLQYGAPDGPVQTAELLATTGEPPFHYRVAALKVVDSVGRQTDFLVLGPPRASASPAVLSGYSISFQLLPDYDKPLLTVTVPVKGDRLDVANARVPARLGFRRH